MDVKLLRPHRRSTVKLWDFCVHAFYLRAVKRAEGSNEHTRLGVERHALLEAFQLGTKTPDTPEMMVVWDKLKNWVEGMEPEKKIFRTFDGLPIETCVVGVPSDALLECTFDNFSKNYGVDYKTGQTGFDDDRYDSDFAYLETNISIAPMTKPNVPTVRSIHASTIACLVRISHRWATEVPNFSASSPSFFCKSSFIQSSILKS